MHRIPKQTPIPCVYVITCPEWKMYDGRRFFKIGRTIHPNERLKQLKDHFNRSNLKYKYLLRTQIDDESRIEKILHRKFKRFQVEDEDSVELFAVDTITLRNALWCLEEKGDVELLI